MTSKIEQTLCIIKPDAAKQMGSIIGILQGYFSICKMELLRLTENAAAEFYSEHEAEPFFQGLIKHMASGPCVVLVLQGPNAIASYRELMGATDPVKAKASEQFSLRKSFGTTMPANAVHGSDSQNSANREVEFFFPRTKG